MSLEDSWRYFFFLRSLGFLDLRESQGVIISRSSLSFSVVIDLQDASGDATRRVSP